MLRLDNMVKAITLLDAQEYAEVRVGAPGQNARFARACVTLLP